MKKQKKQPILKLKDYLDMSVLDSSNDTMIVLKDIPDLLEYDIFFLKDETGYYEKNIVLSFIEVDTEEKSLYFIFNDND
jgi:hypothetical protein